MSDEEARRIRSLLEELWSDGDEPQMVGTVVVGVSFIYPDGESQVHTFYDGRRAEARGLALDIIDDLRGESE